MKKSKKKIIGLILLYSIIPLLFEMVMLMVRIPMPGVNSFPLYIQPIIWGLILDLFGTILFGAGVYLLDYIT